MKKLRWRKPRGLSERGFTCTFGSEMADGAEDCEGSACRKQPVVAVNDGCGARCVKHAPPGFEKNPKPLRRAKPFRRWSVYERDGYAVAIRFDGMAVLSLVQAAVINRAEDIVEALNRHRVVLPAKVRT